MHVYIDESYDRPEKSYKVYVLAALVLYDNPSRKALTRIVRETRTAFENHIRNHSPGRVAKLPEGLLPELKGGNARNKKPPVPGLNDHEELRDNFFRSLVAEANFRLYVLYLDNSVAIEWLPRKEARRYGRLLQNIIRHAPMVPKSARLLAITLDSQNGAQANEPNAKRKDRERHRRWIQSIVAMVKHDRSVYQKLRRSLRSLERERTRLQDPQRLEGVRRCSPDLRAVLESLEPAVEKVIAWQKGKILALKRSPDRNRKPIKVWTVASHDHPCIQAVDVLANFCKRYSALRLKRPPYYRDAEIPLTRKQREWWSGFDILRGRIWWIHNPRLRKPKHGPAHSPSV